MATGHWKLTYPEGTARGVRRASYKGHVSVVIDGQEIELPGITAFALATSVNEVDRVTLEAIGTVEVVYEGEEKLAWIESSDEATQALTDAMRDIEAVRES